MQTLPYLQPYIQNPWDEPTCPTPLVTAHLLLFLQLEPTVRGSSGLSGRTLRPTPQRCELEELLAEFRRLNLSEDSGFFRPVTPERARHNSQGFASSSNATRQAEVDSPFFPDAFVYSMSHATHTIHRDLLFTWPPLSPFILLNLLSEESKGNLSSLFLFS